MHKHKYILYLLFSEHKIAVRGDKYAFEPWGRGVMLFVRSLLVLLRAHGFPLDDPVSSHGLISCFHVHLKH